MPARIPLICPESELNAEQRRVLDALLGRRGGRIPGPYRFTLHCPEITELMHPLGELLRLNSGFPLRLSELAIITTARGLDSEYIYNSHSVHALKGGIQQSAVDAMARGERPVFAQADEQAIYDYTKELVENHKISDETYARALKLFDVKGVVELSALIGYYSMVAATILAHAMPVPEDAIRLAPRKK